MQGCQLVVVLALLAEALAAATVVITCACVYVCIEAGLLHCWVVQTWTVLLSFLGWVSVLVNSPVTSTHAASPHMHMPDMHCCAADPAVHGACLP